MATNVAIEVRNNNIDFALKKLKKKIKDHRVLLTYQEHLEFEKPSAKKRKAKIKAIARQKFERLENEDK